LTAFGAVTFDPSVLPDDIGWLSSLTGLPVVIKGVLRPDDAALAVDAGAASIIVSNHGSRQPDGCVATADALEDVVAAVGHRVQVLVDGGLRTGTDVVKALAMGASAVLMARPLVDALICVAPQAFRCCLSTCTQRCTGPSRFAAPGLSRS